ncbi:sensor histidine kinase [Nocardioides nitrophenolicus]|uniref:sensor histidine kinase n=1 Tax=Nocardioides nitrophenolicus TaxID=60489 RepID=UPI00195DE943|nr:ATP-binding protein [Nocardioides nitrophenolicus]MBM7518331.1 signal transduction histidine kinase [Nocardioides nitrophenolicus]
MTAHLGGRRDRDPSGSPARRWIRRDGRRATRSSWWWIAAVAGLLLYPYLVVGMIGDPRGDRVVLAGHAVMLLSDLLLLGASVALAVDARLMYDGLRGAMAVAAATVAVQDAPLVVLGMIDRSMSPLSFRLTNGHLVTVLVVLVVIHRGRRAAVPGKHLIVTGIALGLGAASLTLGLHRLVKRFESDAGVLRVGDPVDVVLMVLIGLVLAAVGLQLALSPLPAWASTRIGVGMLAIFAARLYSTLVGAMTPPPVAVVGVALFSALTATTAASLLRTALEHLDARVARYAHLAAEAEAEVKQDREVAHEVRSAAAGLAAGARLLASGQIPAGPRRDALERMVDIEAARLRRTVKAQPGPLTTVSVDAVVSPFVVAQAALGHQVAWTPGGHRVRARQDDLAEALGTLITNAADHAGGQGTTISSRRVGEHIEILVSDDGPGLDPAVRDRLFSWGSHGTASGGQGIGLHRARRILLEQGGTLELGEREGPGTTFVIRLPRARLPEED